VPFEPIPLYDVLGKRGFAHWTAARGPADCSVWFYRAATPADVGAPVGTAQAAAGAGGAPGTSAPGPTPPTCTLDVRGLEPPLPMVAVLERLDDLAPGQELLVLHDRRPLFLYPQLEDRGFAHDTCEVTPGLVEIRIRRAPAMGTGR
jgi:uncharacterized protein (DUF2249 family)